MSVVVGTMIGHDGRYVVLTNGTLANNLMHYTWDEQITWCSNTFDRTLWDYQRTNPVTSSFRFLQEADRALFVLRWT